MDPGYCPYCGTEVDYENNFCKHCGNTLSEEPKSKESAQSSHQGHARHQHQTKSQQTGEPIMSEDEKKTRRQYMYGGVLAALSGIGVVGLFFWLEDSPEDVAKDYIQALDEGNLSKANDLIHSDSPLGAGGMAMKLMADFSHIDTLLDAVDITVQDSETVEEGDEKAVVRLTVKADFQFDEVQGDIGMKVWKEDGDWKIWDVAL